MSTGRPFAVASVIARGVVAGAAGTLAMDVLRFRRYRGEGGTDAFAPWELSTGTRSFEDAGAPADVGRRLARHAGVQIADRWAGLTTDVVHWSTGTTWGIAASALAAAGLAPLTAGLFVGGVAFSTAHAALSRVGMYRPIREYDGKRLVDDLEGHLLFGAVTGITLAVVHRARRR